MKKFTIAILLIAATLMISVPVTVKADTGWREIDGIWYYFQPGNATMYRNVRLSIDGHGYFFLSSGAMKRGGWCSTEGGGNWYYAHEDGTLHEGWLTLNGSTYYLDPTYNFMYVGKRYIDGKWYEFDSSGRLIS